MKPSGVLNFENVPADAGDPDVKVYVNGDLVETGGGGSGIPIVKTATVKIIATGTAEQTLYIGASCNTDRDATYVQSMFLDNDKYYAAYEPEIAGGSELDATMIIIEENGGCCINDSNLNEPASVTGDAEVVNMGEPGVGYVRVTGDCVITWAAI